MKKITIPLILTLTVSLMAIFFITRNRDERHIRKNLSSLAATISKSRDEGALALIAKAQKIKSFFTQDCRIVVGAPIPDIQGLEMLVAVFYQALRSVDEVNVGFHDISVTIGEEGITAKTVMTAKATGPDPQGGERVTDAREIEMDWKKIDGTWKIAEVRVVQILH